MLVLGVDTSSPATSLAILCRGEVLALYHEKHDHPPSDAVFTLLDGLLKEKGFQLSDIDLFAACRGPGSFTGLRIGLGMVKGFALALNKPVVGIDALTVMAARVLMAEPSRVNDFAVVVQGFKESTFLARFRVSNGHPVMIGEPGLGSSADEARSWLGHEDVFVDPELCFEIEGARRIEHAEPAAVTVARLAAFLGETESLPEFDRVQPLYLRPFSVGKKARKPEDLR